jgi:pilus assembly protein CpaB
MELTDNVIKKKNRSKYIIIFAIICGLIAALLGYKSISSYLALTNVVAASKDIEPFTILKANGPDANLTIITIPKRYANGYATNIQNLDGKAVSTKVPAGLPITKNLLAPEGDGGLLSSRVSDMKDGTLRAYSIPLDPVSSCGGDITSGDLIDIVAAVTMPTNLKTPQVKETVSKTIASQVRVIKPLGQGSNMAGVVVALNPQEIQEIQFALLAGKISIALNPYNTDPKASKTTVTTTESFVEKYLTEGAGK